MRQWIPARQRWPGRLIEGVFALPFAALVLSACTGLPQSRVALSEPSEVPYDERLVGYWRTLVAIDKDDVMAWHLTIAPGGDGTLDIASVMVANFHNGIGNVSEVKPPVEWLAATAHAAEIDGRTYYNLKSHVGAGGKDATFESFYRGGKPSGGTEREDAGFLFLKTEVTAEDKLVLYFMNPYPVRDLIMKEQVPGRILNCGEWCQYPLLTVSRPELTALIRELTPEKLFPLGFGPFQRIGPNMADIDFDQWTQKWGRLEKMD